MSTETTPAEPENNIDTSQEAGSEQVQTDTVVEAAVVAPITPTERAEAAGVSQVRIDAARRGLEAFYNSPGMKNVPKPTEARFDREAANRARLQMASDQRSAAQRAERRAA